MRFLFELSHPKHYYQFKQIMKDLLSNNYDVKIIARDKDVLLKLLEEEGCRYQIYGKHGKEAWNKIRFLPGIFITYYKIIKSFNPNYIISKASAYAAILSFFVRIKTVIMPDSEVVSLTNKFVAPYASLIITPNNFGLNYGEKHIRINGLFEDCYLHPNAFKPNKNILIKYNINPEEPYYILRFVGWSANHDIGKKGFSEENKCKLVKKLKTFGKVYISSENSLEKELLPYKIDIPVSAIHHALHYAQIYIGDSQTMATESALLGTPSIRYNSFVGINDMSNFRILEEKYDLLKNFNDFEKLLACIDSFLKNKANKSNWIFKRDHYYRNVGDVNTEILNILLGFCQGKTCH